MFYYLRYITQKYSLHVTEDAARRRTATTTPRAPDQRKSTRRRGAADRWRDWPGRRDWARADGGSEQCARAAIRRDGNGQGGHRPGHPRGFDFWKRSVATCELRRHRPRTDRLGVVRPRARRVYRRRDAAQRMVRTGRRGDPVPGDRKSVV